MSKQLTMKAGVAIFAALALAVALAIMTFGAYQPVAAQETTSDNVTRSFSATNVETGGTLDVTITFNDILDVVTVTEMLPDGWTYQSVMPAEVEVTRVGQNITFEVIGGEDVTYTVTAPDTASSAMFRGTVAEQNGAYVGGDSRVTAATAGSTPSDISSLAVRPTSAKPGDAVTVTGMGLPANATAHIFMEDMKVTSATISDSGSFATAFIVPDDASGGSNVVAARASASATENMATATLTVEPDFKDFYDMAMGVSKVMFINNDVSNTIYADIRGFGAGNVMFTAMGADGESVTLGSGSGPRARVALTIGAGALAAGNAAITATQGDLSDMMDLMVVTPAITLSDAPADNSMAFDVTVTGTYFGPGSTVSITADAEGVATSSASLTDGGFAGTITVPAGTAAGEIAITATSDGYSGSATFTLAQAAPGQVMGVMVVPGERSLAVTWTQVSAMTGAEVRPVATGYKVEWKMVSAAMWPDANMAMVAGGDQAYYLISDLTASGQPYMVRVSAVAGGKYGMPSAINANTVDVPSASPADPTQLTPSAPMTVAVTTIDHDSLSVSWAAPARAANTPAISKYVVRYRTIGETSFGSPMDADTSASHVLNGLTANTIYQVQVAAVNSVGTGAYANGSGQTAMAPVEPPKPPKPPARIENGVELSSSDAGANVRIDIDADADMAIAGGEDIVVELPKFGLPSSIDESDVLIDSDGYSGNPSDVTVSGSKITIEVPTRDGTARTNIPVGDYSIKLKQGADITNPSAAGPQTIKITDADAKAEEYKVDIKYVVKLSEDSVTRGDDLTLTLKGFANGTATVYVAQGESNKVEIGQTVVSGNVAEFAIDTSASAIKAGTVGNTVTVQDSKGATGEEDDAQDSFTIKPKVAVDPESTTPSKDVTIKLSDWPANLSITSVSIGGESGEVKKDGKYVVPQTYATTDSDGAASFKVMVPRNVNTGTQTVSVAGKVTTATTTIGINVLALTVSPSSAVPGQQVTISGSGFARNTKVADKGFKIGGNVVDPGPDATSTSSGNISITVALPLDIGSGTKKVELEIAGRDGQGELTIPKPSIELNPAESVPGSVISVTGTNFAANERVEVSFAGAIEEIGRADGNGNVSVRLDIPSGAGVGSTNEVMVKVRPSDTVKYAGLNISAKADHKTPGPAITVSAEARVGAHITISGTNFESFATLTTVLVGGINASPTPAPEADKNGAFEFQARVPRLSAGSHTVTIRDNRNNSATESFEVVTTAVVNTPQEVFGVLGDILRVVWRYDNATGTWASYDPSLVGLGVNDLTGVSRGDIVWVQTTADYDFQGRSYLAGWNLYALE